MEKKGAFLLLESAEFNAWLADTVTSRRIVTVQQHHTWSQGTTNIREKMHS